ncbi:MAG: EpsI family protein [Armatimonadetes bacterium]|nr:EpsI family protein [Armatimonadota bacterium]
MPKAPVPALTLAIVFVLAIFLDRAFMPPTPEVPKSVNFSQIPMKLAGGWQGQDDKFEDRVVESFPNSQMLRRFYTGPGRRVELVVIYGPNDEFHTPESCLFGGGWAVEKVDISRFAIAGESLPFEIKTLRIKDQQGNTAIVSYWLSSDTIRAATPQEFLWGRLKERLRNQKPSLSAFVRVSDWWSGSEEKMRENVSAANREIAVHIARMVKKDTLRQASSQP